MGTYLLRRLAISVPVLLGITLAVYVIISLAPGDPVDALINPEAVAALGPDFREQQREALGLNQPILVRYAIWLKEVAGATWATHLWTGKPSRRRSASGSCRHWA